MRLVRIVGAVAIALLLVGRSAAADRQIEGVVKSIDAEGLRITVTVGEGAEAKEQTLDVLRRAKVTLNEATGELAGVKRGQRAVLTFNEELEVVTALAASGEGAAPMVPELTVINELPEPEAPHTGPWVSADGLTLYWKTHPGAGENSWIWSAKRKSADALFEDAKRHVPGSDMTVTEDGLEMILLQGNNLWVTKRPSVDEAFVRPTKVAEFEGHGILSVPCFSGDGLVLYADLIPPGQGVRPVQFTRASRESRWEGPESVKLSIPRGKRTRFFSVTPDESWATCLLFDAPEGRPEPAFWTVPNRLVVMRREGDRFGEPRTLLIDGKPISGFFPRYVPATNELFYVPQVEQGNPREIVLVRNFDPEAMGEVSSAGGAGAAGGAAAKPSASRPDLELMQGEWLAVSEVVAGNALTAQQIKDMNKRLELKGDKFVMRRTGLAGRFGMYEGTIRLNASATPRQFDWKGKGPNGADIEWRGIYEVSADGLRLCYVDGASGQARPTEMRSTQGSGRVMVVMRREGR